MSADIQQNPRLNMIELSVFVSRLTGVCDEMGAVLRCTAFSPNIKDRLDYSCAVFDRNGQLLSQAAHIPVHLGSMAYTMRQFATQVDWVDGDMLVVNDPYAGGTHLPDVTLISPVFVLEDLIGFVANRAHHADIGCDSPGSMPIATKVSDEGLVISPQKLIIAGQLNDALMAEILSPMLNPVESQGDFTAQIASNRVGNERLVEVVLDYSKAAYISGCNQLQDYGRSIAQSVLATIPNGVYQASDVMDSDGLGNFNIPIAVELTVAGDKVHCNFSGTASQVAGNINCPLSVTAAAVFYVFRCFMPANAPACQGIFDFLDIQAPLASILNAVSPAAVAAGNVETSSRVVDVLFQALTHAVPHLVPAASQGTMNNIALGSKQHSWAYYETIGGGAGASHDKNGLSAVQTHMTNTLNTPIEVVEQNYPLRITEYAIRRNAGGVGQHCGGDGISRTYQFLAPAQATLLTERRHSQPQGICGGAAGQSGINTLNGVEISDKLQIDVESGDILTINTPGGGGWGCIS